MLLDADLNENSEYTTVVKTCTRREREREREREGRALGTFSIIVLLWDASQDPN